MNLFIEISKFDFLDLNKKKKKTFFFRTKSCYQCFQIYNRTRNILQIRKSECDEVTSIDKNIMNLKDLCLTINEEADFDTLFC
jgi:hypothetical protein